MFHPLFKLYFLTFLLQNLYVLEIKVKIMEPRYRIFYLKYVEKSHRILS